MRYLQILPFMSVVFNEVIRQHMVTLTAATGGCMISL